MFGNIINNVQIKKLVAERTITISPFREERLKLAHYALRPAGILWPGPLNSKGIREFTPRHDFSSKDEYTFEPNEYAVAEIEEFIMLSDGIVGHFLPSSSLIERGFGLTAGKLDPRYGALGGNRQKIILGLKNLKNENNVFSAADGLAHVYFVDLRGLNSLPIAFSDPEMQDFLARFARFKRAKDDGVDYD
jgi:deoxycytidine triphosphate deaminase